VVGYTESIPDFNIQLMGHPPHIFKIEIADLALNELQPPTNPQHLVAAAILEPA